MSIMRDYNYVKKLSTMACAVDNWWVYAETAIPSATLALLTLGQPGCTDIVKMKLGLSPWHNRTVKGLLKAITPPSFSKGTQFLYKIGYFEAEKYLWWFMLADVTKEFFLTWQTMVFQQQQCQVPSNGAAYGYPSVLLYSPNLETGLGIAPLHLVPGVAVSPNGVRVASGLTGTVALNVVWDSWPIRGLGVNMTTWQTIEGVDEPYNLTNTRDQPAQYQNQSTLHTFADSALSPVPRHYKFWCVNQGDGLVQAVGGSWTCSTMGRASGLTQFGCNPKPVSWPFP
jgi:hypothetical protein